MAQTKFNGSIVKGCNTTGTATNAGLPEATFTWKVAQHLKRRLEAAGRPGRADALHATRAMRGGPASGTAPGSRTSSTRTR